MSVLYFKTQVPNEAILLFRTITEVGNYNTYLCEASPSGNIYYAIGYENASFKILSVRIKNKAPSGVLCKSVSKCEFIYLPIEIQKEMVNRSNSESIIPFLLDVRACVFEGGFDWESTPEGAVFWENIIVRKQFNFSFISKKYEENIKSLNLKRNENENENQLQRKEIPHNGGGRQNTAGILCRRCKARITVKHLGHQKIVGRG